MGVRIDIPGVKRKPVYMGHCPCCGSDLIDDEYDKSDHARIHECPFCKRQGFKIEVRLVLKYIDIN